MKCFQTADIYFEDNEIKCEKKAVAMVNCNSSTVKKVLEVNNGLDVPKPVAKLIAMMFGGGGYPLHKSGDKWYWASPNCVYELDAQLYKTYKAMRFRSWIRHGKTVAKEPMVDYIIVDNSKNRKSASMYMANKEAKH